MSYTLYDGTIVVLKAILKSLSHILHQAEQRPGASALLEARLHEDMYALPEQVRLTAQFSENLVARLTGREPVILDRDLTTFAKFYALIDTVLKALDEADKDEVNRRGDMVEPSKIGSSVTVEMSGAAYAHTVALPNIYFHLTTTYGILRKEGVPLGKRDYYVGFFALPSRASQ